MVPYKIHYTHPWQKVEFHLSSTEVQDSAKATVTFPRNVQAL